MIKGSCLCGQVSFEIAKDEVKLYQCHCELCRKQGGTYSNAATIIPANLFNMVEGKSNIKSWCKPTGFRSDFCTNCGSPVPNLLRDTDYYWVPAGLLEKNAQLNIVSHIFLKDKAIWYAEPTLGEKHDGFPGLAQHIKTLNDE